MTERREPTISPLDGGPEPEKRRATGVMPERAASKTRSHSAGPPPVSSRPVIVRSPLAPTAILMALVSLGFGGFIYWQSMESGKLLTQTQQSLVAAEKRISDLEQRLMLSDDESTQSITVIQAKVKENASEVRKLWGVSYDTNRKAISSLGEQSKQLEKSLNAKEGALRKTVSGISTELQILRDLAQGQQVVVARADQWMNQQNGSVDSALKRIDALDAQVNKRLKENEEAIKAIDAFRVQVNRELIKLKGG